MSIHVSLIWLWLLILCDCFSYEHCLLAFLCRRRIYTLTYNFPIPSLIQTLNCNVKLLCVTSFTVYFKCSRLAVLLYPSIEVLQSWKLRIINVLCSNISGYQAPGSNHLLETMAEMWEHCTTSKVSTVDINTCTMSWSSNSSVYIDMKNFDRKIARV